MYLVLFVIIKLPIPTRLYMLHCCDCYVVYIKVSKFATFLQDALTYEYVFSLSYLKDITYSACVE